MAKDFPFFAFCSSILNYKSVRKKFTTDKSQKELFAKFGLKKNQIKAAKNLDMDEILEELRKELLAATKAHAKTGLGW
jgi:hypothetical protein